MIKAQFTTVILGALLLSAPAAVAADTANADLTTRSSRAWDLVSAPGPFATFGASLLVGTLAIATQGLKRQ